MPTPYKDEVGAKMSFPIAPPGWHSEVYSQITVFGKNLRNRRDGGKNVGAFIKLAFECWRSTRMIKN